MLAIFKAKPSEPEQPSDCPHDDWTVEGGHRLGHGCCALCGKHMDLPELLRRWKARIERELGIAK